MLNANCCTGDGLASSSLSALSSASLSHPRVIASLVIRWGFLVVAVIMTKIMAKPIKISTCNITVSLDGQVVGSGCQSKQQTTSPSQLAAAPDLDGGAKTQITFTRIIVHADGHREIEGVTPKALPAPDAAFQPDATCTRHED